MDSLLGAIVAGCIAGLIAWGGVRVNLQWLRRDVDLAHGRITRHENNFHNVKG